MLSLIVCVCCDGYIIEVDFKELVFGDFVMLEVGDVVFVDLWFLEVVFLKIEEVVLIGELVFVEKDIF